MIAWQFPIDKNVSAIIACNEKISRNRTGTTKNAISVFILAKNSDYKIAIKQPPNSARYHKVISKNSPHVENMLHKKRALAFDEREYILTDLTLFYLFREKNSSIIGKIM